MARIIVRKIERVELEGLPRNVRDWTSGFVELVGTKKKIRSGELDPANCFVADDEGAIVGYVAITELPRKNWMVIRYLSAKRSPSRVDVLETLLSRALEFAESKKPEFLRATTPALQPYVDVYKSFGFKPVRRDFRISWDLSRARLPSNNDVDFLDVNEKTLEEVSDLFVETLHPYWDWRTEEQGGAEAEARSFRERFKDGERWLSGYVGKKIVGLTGLIPNYYETGHARFRGAYVVPEFRGKGYGRTVMGEAIVWAKRLRQHSMTVYTFSNLDSLAPGALLYIMSGGRIECEYLQMQRV